jgi:hypothetical protein
MVACCTGVVALNPRALIALSTVLDSDFGPNSKFVNKQPVAAPTAVLSEFLPSTCAAAGV